MRSPSARSPKSPPSSTRRNRSAATPRTRSRGSSRRRGARSGRYHALVAINTGTQTHEELHHRHGSVLGTLLPLIERGQAAGEFRTDVPAAWHLAMLMALIHAGSAELQARRVPEADAEAALVATVLGAIASPGASGTDTA